MELNNQNEHRVFGPPGTGKTTYLVRQIERAAKKYGADNILVASYTKSAAHELVSRNISISPEYVGTLHALCYRALNKPEIAEIHVQEFNKEYPQFALSSDGKSKLDEAAVDIKYTTEGDKYLATYNLIRARLIDPNSPHGTLREFIKKWETWKGKNGYVDFSDMISIIHTLKIAPPGRKIVGFFDEVQDFNKLELAVIRQWSQNMEYIVLSGDDDQSIYTFTGASPDAFLNPPIDEKFKTVLSQSWRVPKAIQKLANQWILKVEHREDKQYNPRDEEGEVVHSNATTRTPLKAISLANEYISKGKSVMFLASCGYMLNGIRDMLRTEGIPFHNPYRLTRGDWNPLGKTTSTRTATKDRLLSFLQTEGLVKCGEEMLWPLNKINSWGSMLQAKGIMHKGAKKKMEEWEEDPPLCPPQLLLESYLELFTPEAMERILKRDIDWFYANLNVKNQKTIQFPIRVLKRMGEDGLNKKPSIILSTIHGVKGGEADVVILFPDLSLPAIREWDGRKREERDAIVRMFYVGMTRAKESLILCQPTTRMAVVLQ